MWLRSFLSKNNLDGVAAPSGQRPIRRNASALNQGSQDEQLRQTTVAELLSLRSVTPVVREGKCNWQLHEELGRYFLNHLLSVLVHNQTPNSVFASGPHRGIGERSIYRAAPS